jgi:hypothetical protein
MEFGSDFLAEGASMRLAFALAVSLFCASSLPAAAYTQADASACMSDAFRLCASAIPNEGRVAACLHAKHRQLSQGCADAFARYTRVKAERRASGPEIYRD